MNLLFGVSGWVAWLACGVVLLVLGLIVLCIRPTGIRQPQCAEEGDAWSGENGESYEEENENPPNRPPLWFVLMVFGAICFAMASFCWFSMN